jgi:hypothetical protein
VIIVTGMHRSGTTHFGDLLSKAIGSIAIHEPTNFRLGDKRVSCWYPDKADFSDLSDYVSALVSPALLKKRLVKKANGDTILRTFGRSLIGGAFEKSLKKYARGSFSNFVIKDPFLLRLAPKISSKSFLLIKHPLANLKSVRTQSWSVDLSQYSSSININNEILHQLKTVFSENEALFLCLWLELHQELISNVNDNINIVWHDDFCNNPFELVDFLDSLSLLKCRREAEDFINSTMMVGKTSRSNELHDFKRDSKNISQSWKKSFDQQQVDIVALLMGDVITQVKFLSILNNV